jgi:hypothetical protein
MSLQSNPMKAKQDKIWLDKTPSKMLNIMFPPAPKNTPFFMTPPLTPPSEAQMFQTINKVGNKVRTF